MVWNFLLDAKLEEAARDRDRVGQMALPPFVALAHIDDDRLRLLHQLARGVDVELRNVLARLIDNVFRACHKSKCNQRPAACISTGWLSRFFTNLIAALSMLMEHSEPHIEHTLEPAASLSSL